MGKWKHRLNLAPTFHDEDKTLEEKTRLIVSHIKGRGWYTRMDGHYRDELDLVLEELTDAAEVNDGVWWDAVWAAFYDIADAEGIWVTTR